MIEKDRPKPGDDFLFRPKPKCLQNLQKIRGKVQLMSQLDGIDCIDDPLPGKYYNIKIEGLSEELQ